jgi:hypothetical protein
MQARPLPTLGWRWLALLPALGCLACSNGGDAGLHPVKGKVLYKGQPAAGVLVTFHPEGSKVTSVPSTGKTGEDGTFTLTTGPKEGAPAGSYVVTFVWPEEVKTKSAKGKITLDPPSMRDRFQGAYANQAQSKFRPQIKTGDNQLEAFDLK